MIKSITKLNQMSFWCEYFLHFFCTALVCLLETGELFPVFYTYRKG